MLKCDPALSAIDTDGILLDRSVVAACYFSRDGSMEVFGLESRRTIARRSRPRTGATTKECAAQSVRRRACDVLCRCLIGLGCGYDLKMKQSCRESQLFHHIASIGGNRCSGSARSHHDDYEFSLVTMAMLLPKLDMIQLIASY